MLLASAKSALQQARRKRMLGGYHFFGTTPLAPRHANAAEHKMRERLRRRKQIGTALHSTKRE
jgi:hypothetical protein